MQTFAHDGLTLAFIDEGPASAPAILLVHGFASNHSVNWVATGWVETLTGAGYRVIAIDNRGHGQSDKPHAAAAYVPPKMASDAMALLDHLGIGAAHLFGYSMGARICAFTALADGPRVRSLVFGGLGIAMVTGAGAWDPIAAALLAPSLDEVGDERGRMFRAFADKTGSDRIALAACISSSRTPLTADQMASITAPTLIGVGTADDIAGAPEPLAAMMPRAKPFDIVGRDHMLSVGDKRFKKAVLAFLSCVDHGRG